MHASPCPTYLHLLEYTAAKDRTICSLDHSGFQSLNGLGKVQRNQFLRYPILQGRESLAIIITCLLPLSPLLMPVLLCARIIG